MPIYEYKCKCSHNFEVMQSFSDNNIPECPKCESIEVKKLISLPSFALKGSGWNKDGYGLKSKESKEKPDSAKKMQRRY